MFNTILTVCTGNICRSPVAEFLIRHGLSSKGRAGVKVASAGIGALVNHPADDAALDFMTGLEIPMETHRARQIDSSHTRQSDLILVMQKHHLDYILAMDPTARGKVFLLGHWSSREVPDPYQRGSASHRAAYELVQEEVAAWLKRV